MTDRVQRSRIKTEIDLKYKIELYNSQEGGSMAEWLKDAVFYEIYPQSFQDTNADGIGDFQGIIDHLDYIKELGCNAIWMNHVLNLHLVMLVMTCPIITQQHHAMEPMRI